MLKNKAIPLNEIVSLEELENNLPNTVFSIKDSLKDFSKNSVGSTAIKVSSITQIWQDVVGPEITSHAKVRHIRNSVLHVSVDHPAWITQLKYIQDKIIEQINLNLKDNIIDSIQLSVSQNQSL